MDEPEPEEDRLTSEPLEILLVEDDDDHAELARHALSQDTEWTIHRVESVREAKDTLANVGFDLIILDYQLPDGDGLELLQHLRDTRRSDPVIFLTGEGSEDVAMEAIEQGALDYLVKGPDMMDRLERRAVEALQDWRAIGPVLEAQQRTEGSADQPVEEGEVDLGSVMDELGALVEGPVTGALVRTPNGDTVSTNIPKGVDEATVGDVMRSLHENLGKLQRFEGLAPRRWATVVQTADHLLAISVAPGPLLIALLLRPSTGSMIALRRAQEAARRLWEAA